MKSIPALLADRYEIVRRVGTGGMADVYLARDTQLNRQVALKILHSQYAGDQSFVDRFRREAHAAANLQHPNIVQIYDWGREDDYHFIVMEFVEGRSLKDLIAADAPLPPRQACDVADQVLAALATAHRTGLVHRDIKPGNILLTRDGEAHVTDFGIARAASGDTMTQTGTILGTAYYLSPEQAQGHPTDGRSDIYSLGIVLYEMVSGRRPFEGDSPVTIAMKHVREHPKPPSDHNADVPSDLSAIVLTALAKNPEDRYSTAAQMRRDVQAFLAGKEVTAALPPPVSSDDTQVISTVGPVQRAATKRPGWLLALALTLLVGGLALGAWSTVNLLRPVIGGTEVPDLVNRTPTDAETLLRQNGLEPSFQGNEPSDTVEEGRVVRQLPDPGRRVASGSNVRYWTSSGLPFVTVPDVKGRNFNEARRELERVGLTVGERQDVFDEAPPGTVLDQNPRAAAQVRTRTPIDLTVSRGPQTAVVPEVVGMDERAATTALFNAGFKVAQINDFNNDVPEGIVFMQDPAGGEERPRDTTVQIFVSRGPEEFAMPNVVGMTESAARTELQRRGLRVNVQYVFTSNPEERGRVVNQNPAAGSTVRRGQSVLIQVGSN